MDFDDAFDEDYCYECQAYGDDYGEDEDGNVVNLCWDCPFNPALDDDDYIDDWDD